VGFWVSQRRGHPDGVLFADWGGALQRCDFKVRKMGGFSR